MTFHRLVTLLLIALACVWSGALVGDDSARRIFGGDEERVEIAPSDWQP